MISKLRGYAPKIPYYLFYLGLTIEMIVVLMERTALPPIPEGQIYRVTFALFALKVCFTKYTKKEWLLLIIFSVFTFIMYRVTGQNVAFRAVFFVAAMRGIDIKTALKYTFWLTLSGFLLIIALSFMGIGRELKSVEVYREVLETRYHFGIGHPNTFYCIVLTLLLLFLYCYQEKLKLSILTGLFAVNIGLFLFTDSRTGFAVCTLTIMLAILFTILPKLKRANWIYYVGIAIFLVCIGFSIWAASNATTRTDTEYYWKPGSQILKIDKILTGRINEIHWERPSASGRIEEWTLFASNADYSRVFDMGWVRMFYWFGIIPGIVFIALYLVLINECRREKDYIALLLITIVAIYTVVEPQFISLYLGRNFLLFIFGVYWGQMLKISDGDDNYWWRIGG
ncbi:MAG: hypothetical protein FWE14_00770 [Lachnospiraceae bacterium]|nr:hypothetical protein [Lachnospiraceae bacterium]